MQNPFLFESEYLGYESQFEDSSEFFEDEFTDSEDEVRRRRRRRSSGGGTRRSPSRVRRSRSRTGSGRRRRPRYPSNYSSRLRHQDHYPPSSSSGGSSYSPPDEDDAPDFAPDSGVTRLLQSLLNRALDLKLPEDGEMSVETRSAIRSYMGREPLTTFAGHGRRDAQNEFYEFERDFELEDEISRESAEYGRWIQQSLNKILGLRLAVDGIVGTQTRSAIRSFQSQKGLTADGIVGPITEGALIRAGASPPPGSFASPTPYIPPSARPKGGSVPTGSPVAGGRVTSPFGLRVHPVTKVPGTFHYGIDLGGLPIGTRVNATAAGQVVFAAMNGNAGNNVKIDHGNGYLTSYMHLNSMSVSKGQTVSRGQKIGELGQTGGVTGPHLHYEVRVNGTAVDPAQFING